MEKNAKIIINCKSEEKDKIKKQANIVGQPLQEYCLRLLLNAEMEFKMISR